jgi:hypothetical protein
MTSPSEKPLTLLEQARAALEHERREREEVAKEEARRLVEQEAITLSNRMIQVLGVNISGLPIRREWLDADDGEGGTDWPVVTVDGLDFTLSPHGKHYVGLVRECPKCEQRIVVSLSGLTSLPEMVEAPVSHRWCPANNRTVPTPAPYQPTTEQRYLEALKDLIRQEAQS